MKYYSVITCQTHPTTRRKKSSSVPGTARLIPFKHHRHVTCPNPLLCVLSEAVWSALYLGYFFVGVGMYSRSLNNPALQLFRKCSKSVSAGSYRTWSCLLDLEYQRWTSVHTGRASGRLARCWVEIFIVVRGFADHLSGDEWLRSPEVLPLRRCCELRAVCTLDAGGVPWGPRETPGSLTVGVDWGFSGVARLWPGKQTHRTHLNTHRFTPENTPHGDDHNQ